MKIIDVVEQLMRTILITGGAKRIGKSIAEELGCESNRILIHYNNSDVDAKKLQKDLKNKNVQAFIYKADLSKENDIINMLDKITKDVGQDLDTIINCASLFEDDSAKNITVENFSKHMDINLLAPILLSKHLCKIHQKDRDNNIINIIDQRVMRLNPSYFSYSVSKFGLWGVTQMMAQEYSPTIRVNAIAPGIIRTKFAKVLVEMVEESKTMDLAIGKSEDVAHLAYYLASDKAHFINGNIIEITGNPIPSL